MKRSSAGELRPVTAAVPISTWFRVAPTPTLVSTAANNDGRANVIFAFTRGISSSA